MNQSNTQEIQLDSLIKLLELLPEPILVVNKKTSLIAHNNASAADLLNIHDQTNVPLEKFLPGINLNFQHEDEIKFVNKSGVSYKISLIQINSDLLLLRLQGTELGEKALHSQRLQTLGMLAGSVAHDFNNVLAGILGHTSYLKGILPKEGNHIESLEAIEDGGKSASQLIQEILNFSRLDLSHRNRLINLSNVVNSTCKLLRGALVPKYQFDYQVQEQNLWIEAAEGKIAQVIVNLVVNARNASAPGSTIRLKLASESKILIQENDQSKNPQKFACLEISDRGKGIPKVLLEKIFEPYFTTSTQGTGLGLKIVDSLVAGFGGTLQIKSEVNQGTSILVYLPLADPDQQQINNKNYSPETVALTGKERILVVDDEDGVRKVIKLSLEHFGYSVTIAENAKEAIKIYKEAESPYDLVILDMLMPEISGKDLFLILREMTPEIKLLLVSGYVSEKVVRSLLKQGNCAFLPKPFTIEELTESIRMLFD